MTSGIQTRTALALSVAGKQHPAASERLILRPTEDGWSLIAANGRVLYRGFGVRARRKCIEFARAQGAVAVFS